jgi:hypothetical protein
VGKRSQGPAYVDAKRDAVQAIMTFRIYGVPLADATTLPGHTAVWWCGTAVPSLGYNYRSGTKRIWFLPERHMLGSGIEKDFEFEGYQVHWYDVDRDIAPIEEVYAVVSMRKYIAPNAPQAFRFRLMPTVSPEGPIPTISPEGPIPTISPEGPIPTISPEGPIPTISPEGPMPTIRP